MWDDDLTPEDYYANGFMIAEPPPKKHSTATIACAILASLLVVAGMILCLFKSTVAFGILAGVGGVILFLLGKKLERKDRQEHGADRESWLYYLKDWTGG